MEQKIYLDFNKIDFYAFGRYLLETAYNYSFSTEEIESKLGSVFLHYPLENSEPTVVAIITTQTITSKFLEANFEYLLSLRGQYNINEVVVVSSEESDEPIYGSPEINDILQKENLNVKFIARNRIQGILKEYPEIEQTWFGTDKNNHVKRHLLSLFKSGVWWVNITAEYWDVNTMQSLIYDNYLLELLGEERHRIQQGEFLLINHRSKTNRVVGIYEQITASENNNQYQFQVVCSFENGVTWNDLINLDVFRNSEVFRESNERIIYPIVRNLFLSILNLTELAPFPVPGSQTNSLTKDQLNAESETFQSTPLSSDDPNAAHDLLGFTNDVRAFATIMALKATKAPLAVALFGAWGSGKSFFMNKLRLTIDELSDNQGFLSKYESSHEESQPDTEKPFCEGVVQIEFNAWSYLDANLWAGLVSTIFERLDEYFTENTKGDVAKMHIRQKLVDKLSILGKQKKNKFEQKQLREKVRKDLQVQQNDLHKQRREEILILTKTALNKATDSDEIYDKLMELGYEDLVKFTENPEELSKKICSIKSSVQSVKTYITRRNLIIMAASIVVAAGGYGLYRLGIVDRVEDWIRKIYALPIATFIVQLIPILKKYFEVAKDINAKVKDITDEFNKVKDTSKEFGKVELKLEQNKKIIQENELQIGKLNAEMDDVSNILSGDLTKEAFFDYISQVNSKGDYEKHLGIVSIIRRDFETLSELFSDERIEQTSEDAVEITTADREEVQSHLKKPLDRIILYIDDLDRCDDDKVLEILQAVHLLMAFPLFIVVVGVDKRCVNNALIHRNTLQYSRLLCDRTLEQLEKEFKLNLIHPDEYLEKIFQIPFHLEAAADGGMQDLVYDLLKDQLKTQDEIEIKEVPDLISQKVFDEAISEEEVTKKEKVYTGASKLIGITNDEIADEGVSEKIDLYIPEEEEEEEEVLNDEMNADLVVVKPSELRISPDELEFLQQATWLVGKSPRTMKRFINMYRIIRMHQQLRIDPENPNADYLAIIFILALSVGHYKNIADDILCRCMINQKQTLNKLLVKSEDEKINIKEQAIADKLAQSDRLKALLEIKGKRFSEYIPFISRFSFRANTNMFTTLIEN